MQSDEPFGNGFDDLLVSFIDAQIAFNHYDAVWIPAGDLAVLLPYAAEELALFLLEAVLVLAGSGGVFLVATSGAGEARVEGGKQQ